jgi:hypothetical protein
MSWGLKEDDNNRSRKATDRQIDVEALHTCQGMES